MATLPTTTSELVQIETGRLPSKKIVNNLAANELVFGVVGHAGSGTSRVASELKKVLEREQVASHSFAVEIVKATNVIRNWASTRGEAVPAAIASIQDAGRFQELGDRMRSEDPAKHGNDNAAVARDLILQIRELRAALNKGTGGNPGLKIGERPRAYILDSLKHPAEVHLLRRVYQDAFVLLGIVCDPEVRQARLSKKYRDAGLTQIEDFMEEDADGGEDHGQRVSDTFHLSDYFVDNSSDRSKDGEGVREWTLVDELTRLVKILTHSELKRPLPAEIAMNHAYAAQMQSACLSRQVGAAIIDGHGNLLASGCNEVPMAGGGVYGESLYEDAEDHRCAYDGKQCRNNEQQAEIIDELIQKIPELNGLDGEKRRRLIKDLRKTRIGSLIEFSRAVHAEMDAILTASRKGVPLTGATLFVTAFPCHYCARHIISAGIHEVQYIEPYPKSKALALHQDAIETDPSKWVKPTEDFAVAKEQLRKQEAAHSTVLFRPFVGVAPRFYKRAFLKNRELKDKSSGKMVIAEPAWGQSWHLTKVSYVDLEERLAETVKAGGGEDEHKA
ncbi:MAG: anti-phage dCTP deaminase [Acidobacteriaceae bacterium]